MLDDKQPGPRRENANNPSEQCCVFIYIYIVQLVNNAISPQPICKQEELELCPPHREIIVPVSGCPVAGTESITPYGIITVAVPMSFIGKNLEFFFPNNFSQFCEFLLKVAIFDSIFVDFFAILSIYFFYKIEQIFHNHCLYAIHKCTKGYFKKTID